MSHHPPLGVTVPVPGATAAETVDLARRATAHGYGSVWAAEVQGPDAFTTLGAIAAVTDVDLGVAVVPATTRSAFVLGMSAVSLAELSGGRFTLGIGASSEVIVAGWGGLPFDRPLTRVRETVEAVRPMLAGERVTYAGDTLTVTGYRPHATPPGGRVPLVLGALNPRSCRLVGELGVDGICLNQLAPRHVPQVLDEVAAGAGGELPTDFRVVARLFCVVTDDVAAARAAVAHTFAPYVATSVYNRFYRWMGYEDVAQAILDADGDRAAMAAAFTDELLDELFCIGTPERIAEKVAAYVDAGVTEPVLAPLGLGTAAAEATLWPVAQVWQDA